jgi:autotransporter-associated beta strand protein
VNFNNTSTAGSAGITNSGFLQFLDTSTAGSASIANNSGGSLRFFGTSTAGSATIANDANGLLRFFDTSTAGNATITNNSNLFFFDTSTAGTATIINNSFLQFFNTSTAGSASITNNNLGILGFFEDSTAGSASITNNNLLRFGESSTAGSSSITTNSGGQTFVSSGADGGTARFILNGSGFLDISELLTSGTTAGSIEGAGNVFLGAKNLTVGGNNLSTTFSGVIQDGGSFGGTGGSLTKTGAGTLTLSGTNTYTGGTTISAGILQLGNGGASGSITGNVTDNSIFAINRSDAFGFGGVISGSGAFQQNGTGTTTLTAANTYTGTTTVNAGTLAISGSGSITSNVTNNATFANNGAVTGTVTNSATFNNNIGGTVSGLLTNNSGTTTNSGSLNGGAIVNGGLLANNGAITGTVTNAATFNNNIGRTVSGLLTNNSGTTTNAGALNGGAVVNGGLLTVNGTAAAVTVNAGGTLGGNGIVGNTTINGGVLAPGNSIGTLTVQGSLVFTAASSYMVEVSPANADRTNVTGTATLGGATVNASFAAGTFVEKQYTILNANGGVSGTFAGPVNTNLPANFKTSLSYDANNAYLNLLLSFIPPPNSGLNQNQQNVANAIVGFFNSNGGIPLVFGGLTPAGLTQASGEVATGSQQTTFDAMNLFLGLLTDPFIAGRGRSCFCRERRAAIRRRE